ncbi:FUSC family protein [Streptomyces sp. ACA25]|uniref:FUSC family protein n=1 Tax=Streptomyces sp. ACA25 TaxID=3022596 RepID=UPI002307C7DF|nr:FUSC family protein [Streptomyces sp. ACA25]MDB1089798.1 FUSC family protein [Streptomyces sp. ACA25]
MNGPRNRARRSARRLRHHFVSLLLAGTAAGLAFAIAAALFGTEEAFFAPIAAVVCVGITAGQRIGRAAEVAVGVAVGLTAADLLLRVIGAGPLQLGIAVFLAMAAAVALGARTLMVNQAAVAAVLVVALAPQGDTNPLVRLADALIGGAVALSLGALLAPDPQRVVRRGGQEALDSLSTVLREIAAALAAGDLQRAEHAVTGTERMNGLLSELDEALDAARESTRLGGPRRSMRPLGPLLLVRARLDMLATTVRALARGAVNAVRHGQRVDSRLVTAAEQLADAVSALRRWTEGTGDVQDARASALRAARTASWLPHAARGLTSQVVIGQIRSAAIDVLRATGLEQKEAVRTLEENAGRADDRHRE